MLLCTLLVFGANSKKIRASKALPSHAIIASEFYSTYPQDAVKALCLPSTTLNLLMNAFVHPYLVSYVVFISRIIFFLLITYILIFIIRAVCTHTGGRYYTHAICIVFLIIFFLFIFTTYLINFLIYLSIIFLTLHLCLCVDHIIALIVLYVLYFSYFFNCMLCIYMYDVLSEIKLYYYYYK